MVIFDAATDPPVIQATIDRLLETIRSTGGTPGEVDRWGRRTFAYEVKHRREGYYVLVELNGEPATVTDIDRMLSLADEVVRHKVVRLPERVAGRRRPGPPPGGREGGPSRDRAPSREEPAPAPAEA
jgi:small subunit ribosomal protein S6